MYIVITYDNVIVKFDDFEDVENFLFGECAKWVRQPNYFGDGVDTAEELFNYCMDECDFGAIAEVYKVDGRYLQYLSFYYSFFVRITYEKTIDTRARLQYNMYIK